jgi:hypothetical protein
MINKIFPVLADSDTWIILEDILPHIQSQESLENEIRDLSEEIVNSEILDSHKDLKSLIIYLFKEGIREPLQNTVLRIRVRAPQSVILSWGEIIAPSQVNLQPDNELTLHSFYLPEANAPALNSHTTPNDYREKLEAHIIRSIELYQQAIEKGVAHEQALLFTPGWAYLVVALYKMSLWELLLIVAQHQHSDDIVVQEYAKQLANLMKPVYSEVSDSLWLILSP